MILKKDKLLLGMVLGLIAPLLFAVGYYFIVLYPKNVTLGEFWTYLMTQKKFFTGVTTYSLVINVVLFTIYINTNRYQTAKGIFVVTVLYGIVVLLVKAIQ